MPSKIPWTLNNVNKLSDPYGKYSFAHYQHSKHHFVFLDFMPSKTSWRLKRLWTNCRAHPGSIILSIINTPRDTWCFWTWCCPKASVKRSFLAWSTFLETLDVFGLDAVQNTMETEKNVNQLSGSPGKRNLLVDYQHFYKQLMFLDLMPSKRP